MPEHADMLSIIHFWPNIYVVVVPCVAEKLLPPSPSLPRPRDCTREPFEDLSLILVDLSMDEMSQLADAVLLT